MSLMNITVNVNTHHYHAPVTVENSHSGFPHNSHEPEHGSGGSKPGKSGGKKDFIVDVFAGAIFATIQSFWNTPMVAWVVQVLHWAGLPEDPAGLATGIATFAIAAFVCTLPAGWRWLMRKFYC